MIEQNSQDQTQTQTQKQSSQDSIWANSQSQDEEEKKPWGRIFPKSRKSTRLGYGNRSHGLHESLSAIFDLYEESFTIGRSERLDWQITKECTDPKVWARISKIHCKITKDCSNMDNPVFIEDLSTNGTYVNYEKIGENKKRILKSNDVISLADPIHTFCEFTTNYQEQHGIPGEIFEQYYIGKELGSGAQGAVRLVIDRKTCKTFAMKIVKATGYDPNYRLLTVSNEKEMKEAKILNELEHPNIIRLNNFIVNGNFIYMFLDLMEGGDLLRRINLNHFLSVETAKHFFKQLCAAVNYLHDKGYVHRDIKPENILLETDEQLTQLKLSDFGLSKMLREGNLHTICGTPSYLSPEIQSKSGRGTYTNKVDVWGLGVVLYAMLSGRLPFGNVGDEATSKRILSGSFNFEHSAFLQVPESAKDLIRRMLTVDPNVRPSVRKVMAHPWLIHEEFEEDELSQKFSELQQPPRKKRRVE